MPPVGNSDIAPLPVITVTYGDGEHAIVSCWKPSFKELLQLLISRRVYLAVLGTSQPAVAVDVDPTALGVQQTAS